MASVQELRAALTHAMKRRDAVATSALRSALTAIRQAEVAGTEKQELSKEQIESVLAREVKRREEAVEGFTAGGRTDRAEREAAERDVLAAFLPEPMGPAELESIVDEVLQAEGLSGTRPWDRPCEPLWHGCKAERTAR